MPWARVLALTVKPQMHQYSGDPLNAYILVRIFQVERKPVKRFFTDPLSHPDLAWAPLDENGNYPVRVRS
jgi:hypothetical protein